MVRRESQNSSFAHHNVYFYTSGNANIHLPQILGYSMQNNGAFKDIQILISEIDEYMILQWLSKRALYM